MRRLPTVLVVLLAALLPAASPAAAAPPQPYRVLQLNLCLSGLAGCYPGTQYPAVVAEAVARITAEQPDVVTLNEACSGDVERIAAATGRSSRFATVIYRGAPLPCVRPGSRGVFGNAVLTTAPVVSAQDRAFTAQSGVEERRWLCVMTTDDVRACTSHLSTAGTPAQAAANEAQCSELAVVLADGGLQRATVFAGDVNRQDSCAPPAFWTLRDSGATQAPGIQHAYGSLPWLLQPEPEVLPMTFTDHDGLLVQPRLRPAG